MWQQSVAQNAGVDRTHCLAELAGHLDLAGFGDKPGKVFWCYARQHRVNLFRAAAAFVLDRL
tara:strand:+ start:786 stop:971 length:186 start_codon:yes stop_codon:yes gene_type:complete